MAARLVSDAILLQGSLESILKYILWPRWMIKYCRRMR